MKLHNINIKKHQHSDTPTDHSLLLKMITSYSLYLLVILLLLGVIYQSNYTNLRNVHNLQNESTFISNVELFEADLNVMEIYCRQNLQNPQFRRLFHVTENTYDTNLLGHTVRTDIATTILPEAQVAVSDYFFYFENSAYVLSPNYYTSLDRFYSWIRKYPANLEEDYLNTLIDPACHYTFVSLQDWLPNAGKNVYQYSINLDDLYYMEAPVIFSFLIDEPSLCSYFEIFSQDAGSRFLMAFDKNGKCFLQLGDTENLSRELLESLSYREHFAESDSISGQNIIGTHTSETTGITYYYSFPSIGTAGNVGLLQFLYVLLIALALIFGLAISVLFARKNISPFLHVKQALADTQRDKDYLQSVVTNQKPIICRSYVRQLLNGTVSTEEEARYIHSYMDFTPAENTYNVLYVVAYNNFQPQPAAATDLVSAPSEKYDQIILESFRPYLEHMHYFSPDDSTFAFLLAFSEDASSEIVIKMQEIIHEIHDQLLSQYGIWLFAGIGRNTASLLNLWESYDQARQAATYSNRNYIYFPYEFLKKDSGTFYYPPEISAKLLHFITNGNGPQVTELFNLLHQENMVERSLPVQMIQYLLSDIRNTLLKASFALPQNTDPKLLKKINSKFKDPLSFDLCENLAHMLCALFTNEETEEDLIVTIEKFILNNFRDPSLGLSRISAEFKISESYFSHMFKERTGMNFSTYLEDLRMKEAVRLLRETDISLNEIYLSIGYNNATSFRRVFKKIYGVTPSTMRERS